MPQQNRTQREIVGKVMHEYKHGGLRSGSGRKVQNPKQAIAVALSEAGASKSVSKQQNRQNLRRTIHKTGARQKKA